MRFGLSGLYPGGLSQPLLSSISPSNKPNKTTRINQLKPFCRQSFSYPSLYSSISLSSAFFNIYFIFIYFILYFFYFVIVNAMFDVCIGTEKSPYMCFCCFSPRLRLCRLVGTSYLFLSFLFFVYSLLFLDT